MNEYRRRVRAKLIHYFCGGDPWMTLAQVDQMMYEVRTTIGRPVEIGTNLHELIEVYHETEQEVGL